MTTLWVALLLTGGLSGFCLFLVAVNRWPVIAIATAAGYILVAWELPNPPPLFVAGGTSVYLIDVLSAVLLLIGLARVKQSLRNAGFIIWLWLGLGILLVSSLLRGIGTNDFGTAVNEFRSFLYPFATMMWAMCLVWNRALTESLIYKASLIIGWGLVLVAGFHAARYGLGGASSFVDLGTGLERTTRPLSSQQALVLLVVAVICFWAWRVYGRRSFLVSAASFLMIVVLVQQRTVWVAGIVVAVFVFLVGRTRTRTTFLGFGIVGAALIGVVLAANLAPSLFSEISGSASNAETYDARVNSWQNLVGQSIQGGPATVLFGAPMGDGYGRLESLGRWVTFAPHNWYVTLYLRAGFVGLSFFLIVLAVILLRALHRNSTTVTLAIIVASIVYGWSYSWPWYLCIFLGWAIAQYRRTPAVSSANGPPLGSNYLGLDVRA